MSSSIFVKLSGRRINQKVYSYPFSYFKYFNFLRTPWSINQFLTSHQFTLSNQTIMNKSPQLTKAVEFWKLLQIRKKSGTYTLDGSSLTLADVVATSMYVKDSCWYFRDVPLISTPRHPRYGCKPLLSQDPKINKDIQDSVNVLFDHLAQGWYIYGMCRLKPHPVNSTAWKVLG